MDSTAIRLSFTCAAASAALFVLLVARCTSVCL